MRADVPRGRRLRLVRADGPDVPVQVAGLHRLRRRVHREGVPRRGLAVRDLRRDRALPAGGASLPLSAPSWVGAHRDGGS